MTKNPRCHRGFRALWAAWGLDRPAVSGGAWRCRGGSRRGSRSRSTAGWSRAVLAWRPCTADSRQDEVLSSTMSFEHELTLGGLSPITLSVRPRSGRRRRLSMSGVAVGDHDKPHATVRKGSIGTQSPSRRTPIYRSRGSRTELRGSSFSRPSPGAGQNNPTLDRVAARPPTVTIGSRHRPPRSWQNAAVEAEVSLRR